ncbi:hypothetical protein ACUXAV_000218 [Cupriavidus metallidurans]|jgi:hypothetical protein|uniref:hypothetical protein n=1 Tax=Cupriavidus TaxID=106589 RepID=UPI000493869E|nr:hypothetical protein [Cupriavidus metallidurans]MDE4918181.1 hypothetical protein [Cupriavidus metallidurans]
MSRRSEYRNEVKTRLSDDDYAALQAFKAMSGFDSDSAALQRAVRLALRGAVGTLPVSLVGVSAEVAQLGTQVHA